MPGIKKGNVVAVLTGDVVGSSKVSNKPDLMKALKESLKHVPHEVQVKQNSFETFRGDSFQGVITKPWESLRTALIIRSALRMADMRDKIILDARIAIGIGAIEYKADRIVESDGEAFRNSGPLLDKLSKENGRLALRSPWEKVNEEFQVSLSLADVIISRWSQASAQSIFYTLTQEMSQTEIAKMLRKSQPAVSKNMDQAAWNEIKLLINRFEEVIREQKL